MLIGIQSDGRFGFRLGDLLGIEKIPKCMLKHEILGSGCNLIKEVHCRGCDYAA